MFKQSVVEIESTAHTKNKDVAIYPKKNLKQMKMKNIAKFKITVIIQEDLEVLLIICDRRQKDKTITQ